MFYFDMFAMFFSFFQIVFWVVFVLLIVNFFKKAGQNQRNRNYNQQNNQRQRTGNYGNKYNTDNSSGHYSVGTFVHNNSSDGNFAPGPNSNVNKGHQHSYKHKVEPIKQATVMETHEKVTREQDRKRAEREAMYNEGTRKDMSNPNNLAYSNTGYTNGTAAKNGDYGDMPGAYEELKVCQYCGAKNIVPVHDRVNRTCYFCRQEL